jgi:hypothetical protein
MKKLRCDRCNTELDNSQSSAGYYDVRTGDYSKFAHKNEKYICDICLWTDPRYIAEHGNHLSKSDSN